MTLNEFIEELQVLAIRHGDWPVYQTDFAMPCTEVRSVQVMVADSEGPDRVEVD